MATLRIGLNGSKSQKQSVALNRKISLPLLTTIKVCKRKNRITSSENSEELLLFVRLFVCFVGNRRADTVARQLSSAIELTVQPTVQKGNRVSGRRMFC